MSDIHEPNREPQPKPKGLKLSDLLPDKSAVETSLGTLYVRHANTADWKQLDIDDAQELGRTVVRLLSNRVEDKNDRGPLSEEDFAALVEVDIHLLARVLGKQNSWGELPDGAGLKELGEAVKAAKAQNVERHKTMLADMRRSIGSSYSFLGKSELKRLQEQMAGLADFNSAVSGREGLRAAMHAAGLLGAAGKSDLAGMSAFEKAARGAGPLSTLNGIDAPRTLETPPFLTPPRPQDTPLGRATLESAENVRAVAQQVAALVEIVGGLNQTVVKDVLPAWFDQVKANQDSAAVALTQAANGLWWTKWAVIVSVVVTVLTTWWQVSVSREIDRGDTEQQKQIAEALRGQLEVQKEILKQQALDAAATREAIAALKSPVAVRAAKQ
jgi:hypothetical protein